MPEENVVNSTPEFDFTIFRSGFFQIILADPDNDLNSNDINQPDKPPEGSKAIQSDKLLEDSKPATLTSSDDVKDKSDATEYLVHRSLLASISPELKKHITNEMKEGQEGRMVLHEVDEVTLERFLQWAYQGHYTVTEPRVLGLSIHTKIYAFAERFNIQKLKEDVCKVAATTLEALQGYPHLDDADLTDLTTVFEYAYSNLPVKTDKLIQLYTRYIAWALEILRTRQDFLDLFRTNSDLAKAVLLCVRRISRPPWEPVDHHHALFRYCLVCSSSQIAAVVCPGCQKRSPGEASFISGSRDKYTLKMRDQRDAKACCINGEGVYTLHQHLVCGSSSCRGKGIKLQLSYPD